jgi:hypothetical protein
MGREQQPTKGEERDETREGLDDLEVEQAEDVRGGRADLAREEEKKKLDHTR